FIPSTRLATRPPEQQKGSPTRAARSARTRMPGRPHGGSGIRRMRLPTMKNHAATAAETRAPSRALSALPQHLSCHTARHFAA
ncbi:hypothetical protein, partial [Ralstonia pseudosolanacearum]|uniref:hypothetical protein n=1 Tax=Ralstonia pseudosolanacearum TaxID=1310165 RepID=UPI00322223B2